MRVTVFGPRACAAIAAVAFAPWAGAQSASGVDDRIAFVVSGQTLTNTQDGWGASVAWLHNFTADAIVGIGGEYQSLGEASWRFGRLTLNQGLGELRHRTNLYLEIDQGAGRDRLHQYDYSSITVGAYQNLTPQLAICLEDRQIDVDTTHGNLPRLAVSYQWAPWLSSSVGYAHSVSGSLATRVGTARIDGYTNKVSLFAGLANGPAARVAVNLPDAGTPRPGIILHEYFVGVGRRFSRAETSVILDQARLGDSRRWTLTLSTTLHKRADASLFPLSPR